MLLPHFPAAIPILRRVFTVCLAIGIAVPTTWDEMEQVCAKLKELDPQSIPLGYDSESNWFITMCEQYGSDYTRPAIPMRVLMMPLFLII